MRASSDAGVGSWGSIVSSRGWGASSRCLLPRRRVRRRRLRARSPAGRGARARPVRDPWPTVLPAWPLVALLRRRACRDGGPDAAAHRPALAQAQTRRRPRSARPREWLDGAAARERRLTGLTLLRLDRFPRARPRAERRGAELEPAPGRGRRDRRATGRRSAFATSAETRDGQVVVYSGDEAVLRRRAASTTTASITTRPSRAAAKAAGLPPSGRGRPLRRRPCTRCSWAPCARSASPCPGRSADRRSLRGRVTSPRRAGLRRRS